VAFKALGIVHKAVEFAPELGFDQNIARVKFLRLAGHN
jgi:hypothetical protein